MGETVGRKKKEIPLYHLVFWFDIVTLALMLASFGLGYVIYTRTRPRWLKDYLVYHICYAAWILFSGYFLFEAIYLPTPSEQAYLLAAVFRVLVSLIILYAGPLFALRVAELPVDSREWWLLSIPVAFVFGTVLVFYAIGSSRVAIVPNGIFNFYLGVLFVVASLRTTSRIRTGPQGELRRAFLPLLWFSAGVYAVLFTANILDVSVPGLMSPVLLDDGFPGAFCFVSSLIAASIFLRHLRVAAPSGQFGIPSEFAEAFDLTERERTIAEDLMIGMQSEEIADKYLISPRIVDSHVDTIYRKCTVKDRVEFLRLMERYRPERA